MGVTVTDIKEKVARMCDIIIENETYFCELDSVAGDGDFGMSLAKGFREVKAELDSLDSGSVFKFLRGCSMIISEFCGGASGPIWGSAFAAAASSVKGQKELALTDITRMFEDAVSAIQKRGGARLGDKTLLDALIPAAAALRTAADENLSVREAFISAARAASEGAEETKRMVASKGRASYVGDRSLNFPDAGAMAVRLIFKELTD
ncbi:MAG: dihydroxyacetone kinase subunit L [Clostridiales Family XIII bacterium]|jgi:dihydroxyacetone kinase|nr:dihydroxyacetone kinase subunit L [Clostridiales Family XIII bacterium]